MRKRATKKSSNAEFLASPPPPPSVEAAATDSPTLSPAESPSVQFDFGLDGIADIATALKKKNNNKNFRASASGSKRMQPTGFSPSPHRSLKSVNSISDLKNLASSDLDSIKRQLDRSHSEILKDIEASQSRLQKRFKIQTQACQKIMDEAEKEHKKLSDRINEGREAMRASYAEFMAEVQATASRLCKTSIPELAKTTEKRIASLKSRFGISSTAA